MTISVEGFQGAPVVGACGLRAPLYLDMERAKQTLPSFFFKAPPDQPLHFLSEWEVQKSKEEGHLTFVCYRGEPIDGAVVLYAHNNFFQGCEEVYAYLGATMELSWGKAIYLPEMEACKVMSRMATALIRLAEGYLHRKDNEQANAMLNKALFCALPSMPGQRREVFRRQLRLCDSPRKKALLIARARRDFFDFPTTEDLQGTP